MAQPQPFPLISSIFSSSVLRYSKRYFFQRFPEWRESEPKPQDQPEGRVDRRISKRKLTRSKAATRVFREALIGLKNVKFKRFKFLFHSFKPHRSYIKLRVVHLITETIPTRLMAKSPIFAVIFIDGNGMLIWGYAFNQKRISRISIKINEGDIVFVDNAEVETSNLDLTWIDTSVQLNLGRQH